MSVTQHKSRERSVQMTQQQTLELLRNNQICDCFRTAPVLPHYDKQSQLTLGPYKCWKIHSLYDEGTIEQSAEEYRQNDKMLTAKLAQNKSFKVCSTVSTGVSKNVLQQHFANQLNLSCQFVVLFTS